MAVLPPSQKLTVGDVLDSLYLLKEVIGEGAYGTVYRAEHVYTKRVSAIKILREEVVDSEDAVKRFIREAKLASELDHLNCVRVHEFRKSSFGRYYLVMEYLQGETLGAKLDRVGRVTLPEAREVMAQLLEALGAAHRVGIVHRDVKPENIMLVPDHNGVEQVKLVDFGYAKVFRLPLDAEGEVITQEGFALGTPEYLAPEQAKGESVDQRTDLYSAGVILYRMLVGKPPFSNANPLETVLDHIKKTPPLPSEVAPEAMVPQSVEGVLMRVLAKNADDRYPDALSFSASLESAALYRAPQPTDVPITTSSGSSSVRYPVSKIPIRNPTGRIPLIPPTLLQTSSSETALPQEDSSKFVTPLFTGKFWKEVSQGKWKEPSHRLNLAVLVVPLLLLAVGVVVVIGGSPQTTPTVTPIQSTNNTENIFANPNPLEPDSKSTSTSSPSTTEPTTLALTPSNNPPTNPPNKEPAYPAAKKRFDSGDVEGAISLLAPDIEQHPSAESWLLLARAYAETDDWSKATTAMQKATKLNPSTKIPEEVLSKAMKEFAEDNKKGKGASSFLSKVAQDESAPLLAKKLVTGNKTTRVAAANTLASIGKRKSFDPIPDLIYALERESQCEDKIPFVRALAKVKSDSRVVNAFKELEKTSGVFGKNRCLAKEIPK